MLSGRGHLFRSQSERYLLLSSPLLNGHYVPYKCSGYTGLGWSFTHFPLTQGELETLKGGLICLVVDISLCHHLYSVF